MSAAPPSLQDRNSNGARRCRMTRQRCVPTPPRALSTLALSSAWLMPATAHAYIGPGAGLGALGSLLALLGAVLLVIVGFVWYPVKRVMAKWKAARADQEEDAEQESEEAESSAQQ